MGIFFLYFSQISRGIRDGGCGGLLNTCWAVSNSHCHNQAASWPPLRLWSLIPLYFVNHWMDMLRHMYAQAHSSLLLKEEMSHLQLLPSYFFPCPVIPPRWPAVPRCQFSSKPVGKPVSFPSNSCKALAIPGDDSVVPLSACSSCSCPFSAGD